MKITIRLSSDNYPPLSSSDFSPALAASILLLGSALLFGYTLAPTLLWGDDAMFQQALAMGSLTSHPIWGALAQFFARLPCGDLAFRANLASAVYAVGAIGFLFLATLALSNSTRAALSAGAFLAVSHTFWLEAVRAEVYTLHLLIFFGGLWAFFRWRQATTHWTWLFLGFAFWSVGIVNHLLLTMALPGGLWLFLSALSASERRRALLPLLVLLAIGALLIALLVPAFFTDIIFGAAKAVIVNFDFSLPRLILHLGLLVYQFPFFGILAIPGFCYLWHRDRVVTVALSLMAAFTVSFAVTFGIPESYVFHLPVYGLIALFAGLGVGILTSYWPHPRWLAVGITLLALQVGLYRLAPIVVNHLAPGAVPARDLPGRPASLFFLWPPKRGYTGARWFAETVMDLLPQRAIVIADWTPFTPLKYLQETEGLRQDVLIVQPDVQGMQVIHENNGQRSLFLVNTDPRYYPMAELEKQFRLEAVGPIFALVPQEGSQ